MPSARVTRGLAAGVVAGAAAALAVHALRPRGGPARLFDWDEIDRLARARLGGRALSPSARGAYSSRYRRLAAEVAPAMLEAVGGLPAGAELPQLRALDQAGWLDLNIAILRRALGPLEEMTDLPRTLLSDLGRAGFDRWVAGLLGFLGGRVLGQYDPELLGGGPADPGVYLVEPNVASFETKEGVPGDDLRRWLILHELTHAWQFAAHPWIRTHLEAQLTSVIELTAPRGGRRRLQALTTGLPGQVESLRRVQALMTLIEGHSNLVMNVVGGAVLADHARLEEAFKRRAAGRTPLEVVFWRVTGLELKLRQYSVGERFCRAVHDRYGMEVLNRAWTSPDSVPRLDELRDPDRWYGRVVRGPAPGGLLPAPA